CPLTTPSPSIDHLTLGPAILRRRVPSGTCTGVRQNFSHGQQAGATGEEAAEGRKCEGGAGNGSGRESVHDTNLRSVGEQNRCQVGPQFFFERPAQIPRSFLRSFSLWATPVPRSEARRAGRVDSPGLFRYA